MLRIKLGKNLFSLVGLDEAGAAVLRRRLGRDGVAAFISKLPACIVATEACGGAHHPGRMLGATYVEKNLADADDFTWPFPKRP